MNQVCFIGQPERGAVTLTPLEALAFEGKFVGAIDFIVAHARDARWDIVSDCLRQLHEREAGLREAAEFRRIFS